MPGPWGTGQFRWSKEEPRVGLRGCGLLRPACLGSQPWKHLDNPAPPPIPVPVPRARPSRPHSIPPSGQGTGGGSPVGAGVRTFSRGLGRRLFPLLQNIVLFLISFAQRSLPAPERPRQAARGWAALQSALIVCHRNVSPAQRRARPESGGVAGRLPGRLGRGGDELGRTLLATPRSPGRRGGAAGGIGGGGPGPEGPARGSTRPVRPSTG